MFLVNFEKTEIPESMMLPQTNIQEKLAARKKVDMMENDLLAEVHQIFDSKPPKPDGANKHLPGSHPFVLEALETHRIFHINNIRDICIDYRLRFLDLKYFKGSIPPVGLKEIDRLQAQHGIELKNFKIMAPSKLFKLEDKDDPLLFAPIGNGYYYLIHKWGNDLHPLRKILVWPFKNLINLTVTTMLVSLLATLLVPRSLFMGKMSAEVEFLLLYMFVFKTLAAIVIFYGFALGKNFNPAIWNSKYYNA